MAGNPRGRRAAPARKRDRRGKKKKSPGNAPIAIRLDPELRGLLDQYVANLRKDRKDRSITRAQVIREFIKQGLGVERIEEYAPVSSFGPEADRAGRGVL